MKSKDDVAASGSSTSKMLGAATSFLFVPGDRPERFAKALACEADIVIIDWEASVIPKRKALARQATCEYLAICDEPSRIVVRVNPVTSAHFYEDCEVLQSLRIAGVFLTMVECVDEVHVACKLIPEPMPFVAMIETAKGVVRANDIAFAERVCRIAFGNMDYQTDMGLPDVPANSIYPSSVIAVASRFAGLPQPIAGVTPSFADPKGFRESAEFEKSLGFSAKMCIHPQQVGWTHAVFHPTEQDVAWAKQIITATRNSHAVQIDGVMIDRPVIERARRILDDASVRIPLKIILSDDPEL